MAQAQNTGCYRFVHRADIRRYYTHIRKEQVASQVRYFISEPVHQNMITQYLYYSVAQGGEIHTPEYGIFRDCALSPLIGASLLCHFDRYYETLPVEDYFYAIYMDGFLLFTHTS